MSASIDSANTYIMYAKVFTQIFDSSIADDYHLRHFFTDLLVLADPNGVVDMTPAAIAARTRMPLEDVTALLKKLEQPDPESRTPDADGRRIERLDEHRTWGWHIINYARFRLTASEEQRREKTRARVARFEQKRQQKGSTNAPLTHPNASVTQANATNAMQTKKKKKKMERKMEKEKEMQKVGNLLSLNTEPDVAAKPSQAKPKSTAMSDGAAAAMFKAARTPGDLPSEVTAILTGSSK